VAYFTASVDPPDVNKKFAESLDLDYPILSDPGKEVARAYGVVAGDKATASRWTFYIGKDGKILYIDKEVKPAAHGQDVVERLKALAIAPK
jgi:thioredoxin-dependent peroxiredoxin